MLYSYIIYVHGIKLKSLNQEAQKEHRSGRKSMTRHSATFKKAVMTHLNRTAILIGYKNLLSLNYCHAVNFVLVCTNQLLKWCDIIPC